MGVDALSAQAWVAPGARLQVCADGWASMSPYHDAMEMSQLLPHDFACELPEDADGIYALAARSMFQLFSSMSQGMFLVDRSGRIVWVNKGYERFCRAWVWPVWATFSGIWWRRSSPTPRCGRVGDRQAGPDRSADQ